VSGTSLSALTVLWRWRRGATSSYETETEPLPVTEYEITDLSTGEAESLYLAGDVAVAAPGVELTDLESPPNLLA
jgi:hypothetical protein